MSRKGSASAPSATVTTTLTEESPTMISTDQPTPVADATKAPQTNWSDLDAVRTTYQAADTTTKASMRKLADAALRAAVNAGDLAKAQTMIAAQGAMVAKSATKVTPEIDYAGLIMERAVTHLRAATHLLNGTLTPDGTPDDTGVEAIPDEMLYALNGAVLDLSAKFGSDTWTKIDEAATKMAQAKIAAGRPAPRKSGGVAGHIEDVRDGLDTSTFLSVAAIAKIHTATYGNDLPSTGAVAARLDAATFQSDGVTPYAKGEILPNGTTAPAAGAWFEVA